MRRTLFGLMLLLAACGQDAAPPADEYGPETPAATEQASRTVRLQIEATVPPDTPTVYLTGDADALGPWAPDALAMAGDGPVRTATLDLPPGTPLAYKFTLGTWAREAVGADGRPLGNFETEVPQADTNDTTRRHDLYGFKPPLADLLDDPAAGGVIGTLLYWRDVESAHLVHARHVSVWLPPGYEEGAETETRYRVIYMADGQNLFDPRIANTGTDWGIDEAMRVGELTGAFEPAIVVASWSTEARGEEYSPWHGAPRYARFVTEELKPRVDEAFRTLTGPEHTFHMGSSMGGLLSFHMVSAHPDVFSACGCVSTHFPLSPAAVTQYLGLPAGEDETPYILADIQAGRTVPPNTRYLFDYGTQGLDADYAPTHEAVAAWMRGQGLTEGEDFAVRTYEGADHNEAAWRARVIDQLRWLLADEPPPDMRP